MLVNILGCIRGSSRKGSRRDYTTTYIRLNNPLAISGKPYHLDRVSVSNFMGWKLPLDLTLDIVRLPESCFAFHTPVLLPGISTIRLDSARIEHLAYLG